MKYIDADKLKAEIERRKKEHMYDEMPITIGRYYEDRDLLAFIDSLPDEHLRDSTKMISEDERIRKELKEAFEVYDIESSWNLIPVKRILAWLEKQKENPKSADSIPSDCTSDAKYEGRWHNVKDSLPDSTREVLCKDAIGNYFIGRYYSKGVWEVSMYDDCDKSNEDNPPVVKWCEIPSEKQKEQKPKVKGYGVMRKMEDPHPVDWYMDENGKEHCWGYKFNEPCPWPAEVYIMEAKDDHASDH